MRPGIDRRRWVSAEWERTASWAVIAVALIVMIAGWLSVANSPALPGEVARLIGFGLGGLLLLGVGVGLRLAGDLHDQWRKLDRIEVVARGEDLLSASAVLANGHGNGARQVVAIKWGEDKLGRALIVAAGGAIAGAIVITIGCARAAGAEDLGRAFDGLEIGFAGLSAAGLSTGLYALWLRMRIGRRKAQLFGDVMLTDLLRARRRDQAPAAGAGDDGKVWVGSGMRRYHRQGCAALSGARDVRAVTRKPRGLEPCLICLEPQERDPLSARANA